jgi:hypothetical protein
MVEDGPTFVQLGADRQGYRTYERVTYLELAGTQLKARAQTKILIRR